MASTGNRDFSMIKTEDLEIMLASGSSAYTKDDLESIRTELARRQGKVPEEGEVTLSTEKLLKKGKAFLSFEGRINRLRFILYLLTLFVITAFLQVVARYWEGFLVPAVAEMVQVFVVIVAISLWIRRLHDMDNSPWWSLIIFIPFINFFAGCWLMFAYGTEGPNRFGPDPLAKG